MPPTSCKAETTKESIKTKTESGNCFFIHDVQSIKRRCPQIWNIEKEKDREKEKVGGRPAKLIEKITKETFFCWKNNMKMSGSEK